MLADGRVVVVGHLGIGLWDPADPGSPGWGRKARAGALGVLPDGRVVSGDHDGRLLLWDARRPEAEPEEIGQQPGGVGGVAVLPDGRVVSGGHDGRVLLWDPTRQGPARPDRDRDDMLARAIAVLPDGRVVAAGENGRVQVWDPARPEAAPLDVRLARSRQIGALAALPEGRVVPFMETEYVDGFPGWVLVWDPAHLDIYEPVVVEPVGKQTAEAPRVAMLPDGGVVVVDGKDGARSDVTVWRFNGADVVAHTVGNVVDPGAVAALPDGRVVTDGDCRVLVWDPARPGEDPREIGRAPEGLAAVAALPDGRVVAVGRRECGLMVWDPDRPAAGPAGAGTPGRGRRPCWPTGASSPAATPSSWCGTQRRGLSRTASPVT
ncbi:WD40 repeat domain-containing protein [Dactylosporangium cerinum]|uniref:WD40 repeat domain-containing protein n=1 Tax=Dactylosporangium cerinum TaxID=1434730 RepID=A0ABV9W4D6_9ACTN